MPVTDSDKRYDRMVSQIEKLTSKAGFPPTVRELAEASNRSLASIHKDLYALRADGRVTWERQRPRTLRVTKR